MRTPLRAGWRLGIAAAVFLVMAAPAGDARATTTHEGGRWFVQVAGGVNTMQLDDVKSFYGGVLDFYRAGGIPIETQREFPANLIAGGDVLYAMPHDIRIGVGARTTWSHAYALYEDYSGTLDVVGKMRLLAIQVVVQKSWPTAGAWSPFVELRAGRGMVAITMTEKIALTQYATGAGESRLEGDGSAPLAEIHVGLQRSRGKSFFVGTAGYRVCNVPGPPFDLDVSGFVASLGVGRAIR